MQQLSQRDMKPHLDAYAAIAQVCAEVVLPATARASSLHCTSARPQRWRVKFRWHPALEIHHPSARGLPCARALTPSAHAFSSNVVCSAQGKIDLHAKAVEERMAKKARAEAARLERKKQRRRERGNVIGRSLRCLLSGCAADTRGWDDEAEEEAAEDGARARRLRPALPRSPPLRVLAEETCTQRRGVRA